MTRFSAFRNGLYARMEEISFRTSMTVLGGVVAVAAVVATVTVLTSQGSVPAARPAALSPSSASHSIVPTSAPPTPAVSPSPAAPATSRPAKAPAARPERTTTYVAPAEDSVPYRPAAASGYGYGRYRAQPHLNAAAAWAAWWRSRLAGAGGHAGGFGGYGGHGFGGFGGFGHGLGHR